MSELVGGESWRDEEEAGRTRVTMANGAWISTRIASAGAIVVVVVKLRGGEEESESRTVEQAGSEGSLRFVGRSQVR